MEIHNYSEALPGGNLIATFDVYLGSQWGITYRRIRLMRGKRGVFIAMPSYCEESDGVKKYFPYVDMSKEKKKAFEDKVMEFLKPYLGN